MELAKVYSHAFEGVTTISMPSQPNNLAVESVRFSPLPDENILFYFEACTREASTESLRRMESTYGLSLPSTVAWRELALKLIKQPTDAKFTSLVMNVEVIVKYSEGHVSRDCGYLSDIKIDQMSDVAFETVLLVPRSVTMRSSTPNTGREALALKFKMLFNNDTSTSAVTYNRKESSGSFNLKAAYKSNVFTDFTFKVGDASFPVHKIILATHSPVFMKMWTSDCLESKNDSVTIPDTTPAIFGMFLNYLYSGEIEDKSWPSVKELYYLAEKYDVGSLKDDCTAVTISVLSIDLVCDILEFAYTYNDSKLKLAAKKFAADHIKELRKKEDWKNFEETHLIICYEIARNFFPE